MNCYTIIPLQAQLLCLRMILLVVFISNSLDAENSEPQFRSLEYYIIHNFTIPDENSARCPTLIRGPDNTLTMLACRKRTGDIHNMYLLAFSC